MVTKTGKNYSKRIHTCIHEEILRIREERFKNLKDIDNDKNAIYIFPFQSHDAINKRF